MSIKEKRRLHKISKFIKKNGNLNFREDQLNVLYTINSEDFISKLSRMPKEKKEYILEPLKYCLNEDREEFNIDEPTPTEIYKIINDQFRIATQTKFDISSAPNLMKLYIASGMYDNELYQYLLMHYLEQADYIDVFVKDFAKWKDIFSISTLNYSTSAKISDITPSILVQLADFKCKIEEESKKRTILFSLLHINKKNQERINNIDPMSFIALLKVVFEKNLTTIDDLKLLITTFIGYNYSFYLEYDIDNKKLEILEKLPSYLFNYLKKDVDKNIDIINDLYDNEQIVEEIIKIDEISGNEVIKLLESNTFANLSPESRTIILQKLRINDATENEQFILYKKGIEFLIGTKEVGYLEELPERYIIPTLDFICKLDSNHTLVEQDQILEEKFKALTRISDELQDDEKHLNLFNRYIEFLSYGLDDKKPMDQVDQLQSRSTHFENEYFESFIEKLEQLSDQDKVLKLLYSNKEPEKMEEYYHFIDIADKYDPKIRKAIIKKLRSIQTPENARKILEYISTEYFISADKKTKKNLLKSELSLGKNKKIKNEDLAIKIEDYPYVMDEIKYTGGHMTFANPETGVKIMIKFREKKKKNNKKA